MKMTNTTFNSAEDMITKLQKIKGKTKLKISKNIGNYYDNMNIKIDEDPLLKLLKVFVKIIMKS